MSQGICGLIPPVKAINPSNIGQFKTNEKYNAQRSKQSVVNYSNLEFNENS